MTNVKGEHCKFDKEKPVLQNDLFNIVIQQRRTREESYYL